MPTTKMKEISMQSILAKKKSGKELEREEIVYFVEGLLGETISKVQTGAMLMACHLKGLSYNETEVLMRAMVNSGSTLEWPEVWVGKIASFQSTGSTGNKAKLLLAPAMAACGLRFPIMSARGYDDVGGIMTKLKSVPGFEGNKSMMEIECILSEVGCCVVQLLPDIAPAERLIRDMSALTDTSHTCAFKEACMIAREAALQLKAAVVEIAYGPGEWVKTKDAAYEMAKNLEELSKQMDLRTKILMTKVDWPVGMMIGPSLEVVEAVKCMNGEGPVDFHQLVCKLGGQILFETGTVKNVQDGQELVNKRIMDGSVRSKFGDMLKAQGVHKDDVRSLLKRRKDGQLPSCIPMAVRFTHLSSEDEGYIHKIDMTALKKVTYDLTVAELAANKCPAGGIHLCVHIGSYLKKGSLWGKVHHNALLTELQVAALRNAITLQQEPPQFDSELVIQELAEGALQDSVISPTLENEKPTFEGKPTDEKPDKPMDELNVKTEKVSLDGNGNTDESQESETA